MQKTTIGAPRRRLMIAAVAAVGLALAPAAVTPPGAHAEPIAIKPGDHCSKPGQIKKEGGKTYVCDKNHKWVKVLFVTAGGRRLPISATTATGVLR